MIERRTVAVSMLSLASLLPRYDVKETSVTKIADGNLCVHTYVSQKAGILHYYSGRLDRFSFPPFIPSFGGK